jgi:hypothetical protein
MLEELIYRNIRLIQTFLIFFINCLSICQSLRFLVFFRVLNIFFSFYVDTVQVTPKSIDQRSAALSVLDTYFVTTFKALVILVGYQYGSKSGGVPEGTF